MSVLNASTAVLLRSVAAGGSPRAISAAQQTERIFVANSSDDTVSLLDAHTGAVLRTVRVGSGPRAVAVDAQTGHAFVVSADMQITGEFQPSHTGTVSVLDARPSTLLHTVRVGRRPSAVAMDPQTGRLFDSTTSGRVDSDVPDAVQ